MKKRFWTALLLAIALGCIAYAAAPAIDGLAQLVRDAAFVAWHVARGVAL